MSACSWMFHPNDQSVAAQSALGFQSLTLKEEEVHINAYENIT